MLARTIAAAMLGAMTMALVGCADAAGPERGQASQEALTLSPAMDELYRCLVDRGWNPTLRWDGITITSDELPREQEAAYRSDSDDCEAPQLARVAAMTTEQMLEVYERELETRACLIAEGYTVDDPPSKQQYLDTFHGLRWMAYGASNVGRAMAKDETWRAINEQCRQPSWSLGL